MTKAQAPVKFDVEVTKGDAIQKTFGIARNEFGPEMVISLLEPGTKTARGYVVVDNLAMGPSLGGTRLAPDITVQEVYGLASAMTFKNAAAMLPIGGGKSGLICDPARYAENPADKKKLITAFAEAIWPFKEYIPGPDMGTDENDMQIIYDVFTRLGGKPNHGRGGVGRPPSQGGLPLDEWGLTAHGLFAAARTLEESGKNFRIKGSRVIVQGYGNVGSWICRKLRDAGAVVVGVSDINAAFYNAKGLDTDGLDKVRKQKTGLKQYGGAVEKTFIGRDVDRLLEFPCDILVPAARPDAITGKNKDGVQAKVILQGANNPVKREIEEYLARNRGIICMTDFIVNAGGVIACAVELKMDADSAYRRRVRKEDGIGRAYMEKLVYKIVGANVKEIYNRLSRNKNILWRDAALDLAASRLRQGPKATRDSLVL